MRSSGILYTVQFVISLFGGLLAVAWSGLAADYAHGARRGKRLDQEPPYSRDADAPALSVILAACNEEEKLAPAFRSLLAQEYPGPFEIVAINDRSTDRTPEILEELVREAEKPVVLLHIKELPPGWLGKNHALYRGAQKANGEWLLFTDADIVFEPTALSRAVHLAEREQVQHVVSFMDLDLRGFWEKVFGLGFSFLFFMRFRPWQVRNPKSSAYLGVGGFNMVRRSAYQAIGTHRSIALEVADDMELGRRLKKAGFATEVVASAGYVTVRWQEGLSGLMGGLTKNAYAGNDYSFLQIVSGTFQLLLGIFVPLLGMLFARGKAKAGYSLASAAYLSMAAYHARLGGIPPIYALTLPVSSLLLIAVMFRSMWVTEKNGGITWRGTFYPLELLRQRPIPEELGSSE